MKSTLDTSARRLVTSGLALALAAATAGSAGADTFAVDVWCDRGDEAVYESGDPIEIGVRASDDAYVLVYEIDAEGHVNLLFPTGPSRSFLEGKTTLSLPQDQSTEQLVIEGPVGQGYIVAVASTQPFKQLPWYLRPHNAQGDELGYTGVENDEEGVTKDGKIVGDPFVAMERIRREVLTTPDDQETFSSAYTTYYVHQEVRYPRYLCNDCHRPNHWAWWDGFDPYYSTCTVFDFRVNASWWWGPSYWFGYVPYYTYVYRPNCPPVYRGHYANGVCYSSWDGWNRWTGLWGGSLQRYKSVPPRGYLPPPTGKGDIRRYRDGRPEIPPGFMVGSHERSPGVRRGGVRRERLPYRPPGDAERVADGGEASQRRWRRGAGDGSGDGSQGDAAERGGAGRTREPGPGRWTRERRVYDPSPARGSSDGSRGSGDGSRGGTRGSTARRMVREPSEEWTPPPNGGRMWRNGNGSPDAPSAPPAGRGERVSVPSRTSNPGRVSVPGRMQMPSSRPSMPSGGGGRASAGGFTRSGTR